jgi:hypothetical protein
MSDDYVRRRHQQLTRCSDAAVEELYGEDLFSGVEADPRFETLGYRFGNAPLAVGDELWEQPGSTPEKVVLCHGSRAAVELAGEGARVAMDLQTEFKEPLSAVVTEIEEGLVTVRFLKPFRVN